MAISKDENEFLKIVVRRELARFEKEKIVTDEMIVFLEGERKYEEFLRELLRKLESQ
jgi:hypothetical protein